MSIWLQIVWQVIQGTWVCEVENESGKVRKPMTGCINEQVTAPLAGALREIV